MHLRFHHARGWIAIVAIAVLVAVHVWLLRTVASHVSLALAAGVVGLVVLKYAWWRRSHPRGASTRN